MSRSILPLAEAAGARVQPDSRVEEVKITKGRAQGVTATMRQPDGTHVTALVEAEHVFVCAGPTETPALLQRSGVRHRVGRTLAVHPMLKVAARFPFRLHERPGPIPLLQVKEFWPDISFGGGFMSPGYLAMHLSENWPILADRMDDVDRIAIYYVAILGTGRGSVRWSRRDGSTRLKYQLSKQDIVNLHHGLSRLSALLLEAGADEVYPCVQGLPTIRSRREADRWMEERTPKQNLSLTTVHAFSACPAGERRAITAVDSFGRLHGHANLFINDASMLPSSPGVNPQGSIMALARRNALHFAGRER